MNIFRKIKRGIIKLVKSKWYKYLPGLVLKSIEVTFKRKRNKDRR